MTEPTPERALVETLRLQAERLEVNGYRAFPCADCGRYSVLDVHHFHFMLKEAADLLSRLGREREQYRVQVEERYGAVAQWQEQAETNRLAWLKSEATVSRLGREHRALRELVEKWRERDASLCRKADAQLTTQYAKSLADRAECYGRCADELDAVLASPSPAGGSTP